MQTPSDADCTRCSNTVKLYMGPMFSGKTNSMLNMLHTLKYGKATKVLLMKYSGDTRDEENIVLSRSGVKMTSDAKISTGKEAWKLVVEVLSVPRTPSLTKLIVGIDEGQFIVGLDTFITKVLALQSNVLIQVYIAALDSDYKRAMWPEIVKIIPLCNDVKKNSAICMGTCQGNRAQLTKRIVQSDELELIGSDEYIASCFICHLEGNSML